MSRAHSESDWLQGLKAGDPIAAQRLFERHWSRLVRLARKRLGDLPRRAADEEDVAQSAFKSFCLRAGQGKFPQLADRDDLWRLLIEITANKAADLWRRERAAKRGRGKVRGDSALSPGDSDTRPGVLAAPIDDGPTPEQAALLVDEIQSLLDRLGDDRLREIALLKLEGYTTAEIAERLDCHLRAVQRKLKLIRHAAKESDA